MTHAEAVAKVSKLLRLATSSNPNEAALAASRAQEIMDRFKLEGITADFDSGQNTQEPIDDFKADLMDAESSQLDTWRCRLASAVAACNECKIYLSGRPVRGFSIVGRARDAVIVRLLYGWLKSQVNEMAARECAGTGRTHWNNWRIGCVETVSQRLADQRKKTATTLMEEARVSGGNLGLVRMERSLAVRDSQLEQVDTWMQDHLKLTAGKRRYYRSDPSAREAGRLAGHRINMSAPDRSLGF